jgi:hypothetical protein
LVLEDDLALTVPDLSTSREQRYATIGRDPAGRILVVVFTWRDERIRIISARGATRSEVHQYEEGS